MRQSHRAVSFFILSIVVCFGEFGNRASWAQPGLRAYFPLDEGAGELTRDTVNGLTGKLHGASWQKNGAGYCLRFDGVDDYVECGSAPALSPTDALTLAVWICPDRVPPQGEPGIAGKAYDRYVLTYYKDGQIWFYIGGGGNNVKAPVSPGSWHHIVGTYESGRLRLYVDGELVAEKGGPKIAIPDGGSFFLGTSQGDPEFTRGATFAGLIDDVRLYDRALSPEEIRRLYLTTNLTQQLAFQAIPIYGAQQIIVRLDWRGLGPLPQGTLIRADLFSADAKKPLLTERIILLPDAWHMTAKIRVPPLAPGAYILQAQAMAHERPYGLPARAKIDWPALPRWPVHDPHIKILNNFVSELRRARNIVRDTRLSFTNPRRGWLYFKIVAKSRRGEIEALVPACRDNALLFRLTGENQPEAEAMRWLPAGSHELIIHCRDGGQAADVVVRAIPEIGYCRVDCGPQLLPYGPADWDFLRKYVLPNINLAVSRGDPRERERWVEWKRQGKRWIVETPLPGLGQRDSVSADDVYASWAQAARLDEPLLDGLIVDEFGASEAPIWEAWHAALKRLRNDPRFAGRVFYPYCGPLHTAARSRAFAQTCLEASWAMALERYLPEAHTEAEAWITARQALVQDVLEWAKIQPALVRQLLVVTGFLISTPPEFTNIDPAVDFKAFMDIQMNVLANDPALFGIYGVTSYLSAYSEEEIIRWMGRLYRHYCLEGQRKRLTDYYELRHLRNPDFEEGLAGWHAEPAAPDSVTTGRLPGLSWLQGRYPPTARGEHFLLLRRVPGKLNRVWQLALNLQPGRMYSVKMISADYDDLKSGRSRLGILPIRLDVEDAEIITARTFQHPFKSCYSHAYGPFDRDNPACFNIHHVTFRAKKPTARIVISDEEPKADFLPAEQLLCNFVELQPYYEPENMEGANKGPESSDN